MKKKFGIEFEMVVYYHKQKQLDWLERKFEKAGFDIDDDGSINIEEDIIKQGNYTDAAIYEIKTQPFTDIKKFLKKLNKLFFRKNQRYSITINEGGGDIRIDFNNTTGTHIHFSSVMNYNMDVDGDDCLATQELKYFDTKICKRLADSFVKKIKKYPSIQNACYRNYARAEISKYQRYSAINISNENGHGTIEFRLCNLRGVTTKQFIPALRLQLVLVLKSIIKGYKMAYKNLEREKKYLKKISEERVKI